MKTIRITVLFIFGLFISISNTTAQNCTLTVEAGDDITLCASGTANLNATASDLLLGIFWEPANLFTDPNSLNTSISVTSTVTAQLTVATASPINLISNGDFNQGNTGFTSTYELGTGGNFGPLSSEGQYTIVDNAEDAHNHYEDCTDHNGAGGNMMVVNGSGEPNDVWCQNITVNPNSNYMFSAWVTSAISTNPAQLQFSINGATLGDTFTALSTPCVWTQFFEVWNSGGASSIDICVVNVNDDPSGNDFALDDISFREICEATDDVTISIADLDPSFNITASFCQSESEFDLNQFLEAGATTGGAWSLDGSAITTLDPSTLNTGDYLIRYTISDGPCEAFEEQSFEVIASPSAGIPNSSPNLCAGKANTFILADLLDGEDDGGTWEEISDAPSTGNAFDPDNATFNTENQSAGTYNFRYTLSAGGACPDAEIAVAIIIESSPIADAGEDMSLGCGIDEISIGGAQTSNGNYSYNWESNGGNPVIDPTAAITEVNSAGIYILTVTSLDNGCTATDEVTIDENINDLVAEGIVIPVSCFGQQDGIINLDNISGGTAPYSYALNGGNFISFPQFSNLGPGSYMITVRDANGCESFTGFTLEQPVELSAEVISNISADSPVVLLGDSLTISVEINTSMDNIESVVWSEAIANCDNCTSFTATPIRNTTYAVEVKDKNGCSTTAALNVRLDRTIKAFIPNAFSPNGDGINDVFMIYSNATIQEVKSFQIMDRWGNLVFSAANFMPEDPNAAWDGTLKGQRLNPSVFVYLAEIELADGETVILSGDVALLY